MNYFGLQDMFANLVFQLWFYVCMCVCAHIKTKIKYGVISFVYRGLMTPHGNIYLSNIGSDYDLIYFNNEISLSKLCSKFTLLKSEPHLLRDNGLIFTLQEALCKPLDSLGKYQVLLIWGLGKRYQFGKQPQLAKSWRWIPMGTFSAICDILCW